MRRWGGGACQRRGDEEKRLRRDKEGVEVDRRYIRKEKEN